MANYNIRNIFQNPTKSGGTAIAAQALTVTSTATKQFAAFNQNTDTVFLDVQTANVWVTFDGTTPASGNGHILTPTLGYALQWSAAAATAAKFVATTTTNAVIYASEFQS